MFFNKKKSNDKTLLDKNVRNGVENVRCDKYQH